LTHLRHPDAVDVGVWSRGKRAPEIVEIACRVRPDVVTLVPERREELTTEGGLDVAARASELRPIVKLLADGLTEKQIASRIHRSQHTVHDHVKTNYASLGISTRHDLMELWSGRMALAERMPLPVMPGLSAARSTMIQATVGAGHTASPQAIGWLEPSVQLKAG
jgi:pyridoxine 5'-phosphate synthase PdxJ